RGGRASRHAPPWCVHLTVRRRMMSPLVVRLHNGNRAFTYGGEHDVAAIEARHAPAGSAGYRQTSGHGDEHRRVSRLGLGDTHAAGGAGARPTGASPPLTPS